MTTQARRAIDSAIEVGQQPKAGSGGLGLILPIPGARFRVLYDKNGITKLGKYYYEQTGLPEPGKFDFTQDATRRGRSQYIKLLDGSEKKISTLLRA